MAENTRLNVEVDASRATTSVNTLTAAFARLQSAASSVGSSFTRLGGITTSVFGRMASLAGGAFRVMRGGFKAIAASIRTFMSVFRTALKLVAISATTFTLFARSVADAGNTINKFINTLVILKGNTTDATAELEELFSLANRLGTSFTAAAQPFTKFAAAAAGALSDQSIRDVFEAFSTVGVALQLGQSEVTGVFLALQQIASKGVVSMEELRLQLAERVPGAMRLAASSMDMSMAEFEKAVQQRTINAGEFLERFAAKLKATFGDAAELASTRLFANIQRLGNELLKFRQKVFASGFESGLQNLVQSAINFLKDNPELAEAMGRFSESVFNRVADFLNNLSGDKVISIINRIIAAIETLINALNVLIFKIQMLFNDELKSRLSSLADATEELGDKLQQREEGKLVRETGQITVSRDSRFLPGGITRTATRREMAEAVNDTLMAESALNTMRIAIEKNREELAQFGIEFGKLPEGMLDVFTGGELDVRPARVSLPRIEPIPEDRRGAFDLSNQPVKDFGMSPSLLDALERADRMIEITTPEFYQKLLSGEIRDAMSDLDRVTLDLNVANEAQSILLDKIKTTEEELDALRKSDVSNEQAAELNQNTQKLNELQQEYLAGEERKKELKEELIKLMAEEQRYLAQFKTFQQELEETFTSTRDVFINMIKSTEDAIADFVATGKMNFKDLADEIIRQLTRMAVQAFLTRFVLGPLLGPMSDNIGSGLGGTFAEPTPNSNMGMGPPVGHTGGVFHDGGIVEGTASRFSSLKRNERAIIVERGEGVFTRDQMANMASLSDVSRVARSNISPINVSAPTVNVERGSTRVEVINNTPSQADVQTIPQGDGSELIRVMIGAVASDIAADGPISQTMKGKFGLRNRTNIR